MKICYLVIAHNNPNHFQRLIKTLSASPNAMVFVHVDNKADLREFQYVNDRIVFIKERVKIYWGGFSMVRATLNLLDTAIKYGYTYSHFCLLSGSCYPIKSMAQIEQYLQQHQRQNFINIAPMLRDKHIKNFSDMNKLSRITSYYLEGSFYKNIAYNPLKFALVIMKKMINRLYIQRDHNPIFAKITPYAGESWWVFSDDAVRYIMQFVALRPEFVQFFKNVKCPDESFFHTIIGNSNFTYKSSRTYTDWSGKHSHCYPAVINNAHLEIFKKSNALFARKFSDDSVALLSRVQENL